MANGMTPDDARKEAERRFGDVQRTRARLEKIDRAQLDNERRAEWWGAFAQDLRYAHSRPSAQTGLRPGRHRHARVGHRRERDDVRHRRSPAVSPTCLSHRSRARGAVVLRRARTAARRTYPADTGYRRFTDVRDGTTSFDAMTPFFAWDMAVGAGETTRGDARRRRRGRSVEDVRCETGDRALLHGGGRRAAERNAGRRAVVRRIGKRSSAAAPTYWARRWTLGRRSTR